MFTALTVPVGLSLSPYGRGFADRSFRSKERNAGSWRGHYVKRTFSENCTLLGHYTASSGHSFPTFRDNLSAHKGLSTLQDGTEGCPETSAMNCHYNLRNNPEQRSSHLLRGGNIFRLCAVINMATMRTSARM